MSYDLQTSFSVEFDTRGKVSLAIPKEGIKLESGWVITPFYYPSVRIIILILIFVNHEGAIIRIIIFCTGRSPSNRLIDSVSSTMTYQSVSFSFNGAKYRLQQG